MKVNALVHAATTTIAAYGTRITRLEYFLEAHNSFEQTFTLQSIQYKLIYLRIRKEEYIMASFATTANAVAVMHNNRRQASVAHAGKTVPGVGATLSVPEPARNLQQTGYDLLLSVNQVDVEQFKSEDKDSFLKYWDAFF